MQTQWYLCEIKRFTEHQANHLKKSDNLLVKYPDIFVGDSQEYETVVESNKKGEGGWFVWLPIIPRVGDTLQFAGWQVQVSKVLLQTDFRRKTGTKEGLVVSARISIRNDTVLKLSDPTLSAGIESRNNNTVYKWENFANRGHDLQYFAWELKHEFYAIKESNKKETSYYCWHTRIRPLTGDVIQIENKRWRITSVELASANNSVDGWLSLEGLA